MKTLIYCYLDSLAWSPAIWTNKSSFLKFPRIYKGVDYFIYRLFCIRILGVMVS